MKEQKKAVPHGQLGGTVDLSEYFAQIKGMKGFDEMMATIRK
jgi:hypothetical protein